LAGFLYLGAYLCDAVFSISRTSTSETDSLRGAAIGALLGGIAYLAYAEIVALRRPPKEDARRVYT
jgi:hypothetical protein